MALSRWRLEVANREGQKFGELTDPLNRQLVLPLNGTASCTCALRTTDPLLERLYQEDARLLVYEMLTDGSEAIRFHGEVNNFQATNNEQTGASVVITAADPSWRFTKRVMGRTATPTAIASNSADVAKQLIDAANTDGETGVRTVATTAGGSISYPPGPYKLLSDCITDLSAGDTMGFDWRIRPIEQSNRKIGEFTTASDMREDKPNAGFEFGPYTRTNVKSFDLQTSHVEMANKVYNPPADLALGAPLTEAGGPHTAIAAQSVLDHGLHAAIVETSDITDTAQRQSVVDWHILLRYNPRQVLSFTPTVDPEQDGTVPIFGLDYNLGDRVPVRIAPEGIALIDGYVRVYKMTIDLDNNGRATFTPTTVQE